MGFQGSSGKYQQLKEISCCRGERAEGCRSSPFSRGPQGSVPAPPGQSAEMIFWSPYDEREKALHKYLLHCLSIPCLSFPPHPSFRPFCLTTLPPQPLYCPPFSLRHKPSPSIPLPSSVFGRFSVASYRNLPKLTKNQPKVDPLQGVRSGCAA